MGSIKAILRRIHEDETGHIDVAVPGLVAGIGAIALGIGAATDTDIASIAGGVVLGLGIVASGVARHRGIDYDLYERIEVLEKK